MEPFQGMLNWLGMSGGCGSLQDDLRGQQYASTSSLGLQNQIDQQWLSQAQMNRGELLSNMCSQGQYPWLYVTCAQPDRPRAERIGLTGYLASIVAVWGIGVWKRRGF